jgi:hypothetical protein
VDAWLSDPVTEKSWSSKWTSYTLTVRFPLEARECVLKRRFSDFVILRNLIVGRFPGVLVPPLPEKRMIGSMSPSVISHRMRHLQLFCDKILRMPFLLGDCFVQMFFSAGPKSWQGVRAMKTANYVWEDNGDRVDITPDDVVWPVEASGPRQWRAMLAAVTPPLAAPSRLGLIKARIAKVAASLGTLATDVEMVVKSLQTTSSLMGKLKASFHHVAEDERGMVESALSPWNPTNATVAADRRELSGKIMGFAAANSAIVPTAWSYLLAESLRFDSAYASEVVAVISRWESLRPASSAVLDPEALPSPPPLPGSPAAQADDVLRALWAGELERWADEREASGVRAMREIAASLSSVENSQAQAWRKASLRFFPPTMAAEDVASVYGAVEESADEASRTLRATASILGVTIPSSALILPRVPSMPSHSPIVMEASASPGDASSSAPRES